MALIELSGATGRAAQAIAEAITEAAALLAERLGALTTATATATAATDRLAIAIAEMPKAVADGMKPPPIERGQRIRTRRLEGEAERAPRRGVVVRVDLIAQEIAVSWETNGRISILPINGEGWSWERVG
jgi:hypothetical protein